MLKLHMRTGSEGPTHDPYGYTEMEFETDRVTLTLHKGLFCWFKATTPGGGKVMLFEGDSAVEEWIDATGLTPDKFERYYHRLHGPHERCPDCGTRSQWGEGYVGESFCYCPNVECHGWRGWSEDPTP